MAFGINDVKPGVMFKGAIFFNCELFLMQSYYDAFSTS